jgi:ATP-binding cassette, subfamily C (CFTR/MRP), member 1
VSQLREAYLFFFFFLDTDPLVLALSNNLSSLVSGWTLFETSLGAIARLKSFEAAIKPEDKAEESQQPPSSWPDCGGIEFRNVTASYE